MTPAPPAADASGPVITGTDDRGANEPGAEESDDPYLRVDLDGLCTLLGDVLAAEGVPARAEAGLTLVDADAIADLKSEHLGGEGPTDVLSFPLDGAGPVPADQPWLVGDVVVCPQVAADQAAGHAGTVPDELALLVVHGGLHLCGWDHGTDAERRAMWDRERELLSELGRSPSADPWSDR